MPTAVVVDFETADLAPPRPGLGICEICVYLVEVVNGVGTVTDRYTAFNDPKMDITPEAYSAHGLNLELLNGKQVDWARAETFFARADVAVAHSARFDRQWVGADWFQNRRWVCSLEQVDWKSVRMPCRCLRHLAWEHGVQLSESHRAEADVETLCNLLSAPHRGEGDYATYWEELLDNAQAQWVAVKAFGSPFEAKDVLRQNGWQWSANAKVWWKLARKDRLQEVGAWLLEHAYLGSESKAKQKRFVECDPSHPRFNEQYQL